MRSAYKYFKLRQVDEIETLLELLDILVRAPLCFLRTEDEAAVDTNRYLFTGTVRMRTLESRPHHI